MEYREIVVLLKQFAMEFQEPLFVFLKSYHITLELFPPQGAKTNINTDSLD